jgi:YesN/AraC family two-component response regulator
VTQTLPDLVLVDISLKQGNGLELIKRVQAFDPDIKMSVVSGFQDSLYADAGL